MIDDHPLPWLAPLLNGVEHANFFETRATEYSKGATKGDWNHVWDSFDERKKGKANDDEGEDGGRRYVFRREAWRMRRRVDLTGTKREHKR